MKLHIDNLHWLEKEEDEFSMLMCIARNGVHSIGAERQARSMYRIETRSAVYFIDSIIPYSPIKIGHAMDIWTRIWEHQRGCLFELRVLGILLGGAKAEGAIHRHFSELRTHGEWFIPNKDLLEFIETKTQKWFFSGDYHQAYLASIAKNIERAKWVQAAKLRAEKLSR